MPRKLPQSNRSRPVVAFQGELGAFSHAACVNLLGPESQVLPCPSFADVFSSLKRDHVSRAVIPIENTLHGSVHENYDLLLANDFTIVGETSVRIAHQLITMPDVKAGAIKRVYSHPVALNQCRRFFAERPEIEAVPYYDTAGSVKMLSEQRPPDAAAIASVTAAAIYGGVIRRKNIEDDCQNFTRFFLLSKQKTAPVREAGFKTSLVFTTPNRPGVLFRALACFALRDLSLTKIESRPLHGKPWEYLFYVDLMGSTAEPAVKNALANLAELTESLRVLGCYRAAP